MNPKEIYEHLRKKIIWLELKPESILNLSEVAASLKVSRTPIKESLIFLQSDGWVVHQQSHFMVTPLSLERIKEITEIRSLIETQANLWALNRMTPEEFNALSQVEEEIILVKDTTSNKKMIELDFKFHRILFKAAKNSQLNEILERMLGHYLRFWLSMPRKIESQSFFAETIEIILAIKAKDPDRLMAASTAHIRKSIDEILGVF